MRTRRVGPAGWRIYLNKAEEFQRAMADAERRSDWNAVGLCAVHMVISASDAITAFYLGERSAADRHVDSADLLRQLDVDDAPEKADQAVQVLDAKTLVEYEARDFQPTEAAATAKKAKRFLPWVRQNIRVPQA